mgnify:FL=1
MYGMGNFIFITDRKKVLLHHPDKRKAAGKEVLEDDDYFTNITKGKLIMRIIVCLSAQTATELDGASGAHYQLNSYCCYLCMICSLLRLYLLNQFA